MRAYLLVSGTIFGLFAAVHLFIAYEHAQIARPERESVLAPAAICLASAGLSGWAFRLARRAKPG